MHHPWNGLDESPGSTLAPHVLSTVKPWNSGASVCGWRAYTRRSSARRANPGKAETRVLPNEGAARERRPVIRKKENRPEAADYGRSNPRNQRRIDFLRSTAVEPVIRSS